MQRSTEARAWAYRKAFEKLAVKKYGLGSEDRILGSAIKQEGLIYVAREKTLRLGVTLEIWPEKAKEPKPLVMLRWDMGPFYADARWVGESTNSRVAMIGAADFGLTEEQIIEKLKRADLYE